MDEKLSIKINIAERYYPLKIERNEEEKIRKAAKIINDTIYQYKNKYGVGDKDIQDFLSMVALQYATKAVDNENKCDDSQVIQDIKDLTHYLEEYLKKI
jgi:cell division protein ZapA